MPKEHWRDRQVAAHLDEICRRIAEHDGPFAIGLDMAADQGNWGLCVLLVEKTLGSARLLLLLPRPAARRDGQDAASVRLLPSANHLRAILQAVGGTGGSASLGVDVPFGWPVEHGLFTGGWSAVHGRNGTRLPSRDEFERRLCDREFRRAFSGLVPFAVGADSIAQAAFVWCKALVDLGDLAGPIDVGLEKLDAARVATFETYPAAFVKNVSPKFIDYKSLPDQRAALLRDLLEKDYRIMCPGDDDARPVSDHPWCLWAVQQSGSPDAFDSLLCACTAWDHLRARLANGCVLSTPENVMGHSLSQADRDRVLREGWILVRMPR